MRIKSNKPTVKSSSRSGESRLSNVCKPSGMTVTEWQVKLREQAARKEILGVFEVDVRNEPGVYQVVNAQSRGKYRVSYYGRGHHLNSCSCMNFRTSRLGTCKHLEAVRLWVSERASRKIYRPDGKRTVLYMDYTGEPCVKIEYGTEDQRKLKKLFSKLAPDGKFTRITELRLHELIAEASQISAFFACREDVSEYVSHRWDTNARGYHLADCRRIGCKRHSLLQPEWWCSVHQSKRVDGPLYGQPLRQGFPVYGCGGDRA